MSKTTRPKKTAVRKAHAPSTKAINALFSAYAAGRYAEVANLAGSMTAKFPRFGLGWMALGVALKQTGKNADALLPLQKAVALLPNDADAHNNLGVTLMETGRLDEAEKSYRRALHISKNYAQVHNNLGNVLRLLHRWEKAEASYRKAIAIKPDDALTHNNLGVILKELNRLEEARASVMHALSIAPDYAVAHSNLSAILLDMGLFEEALNSARQALQIDPRQVMAYNNLASAQKDLMRFDDAEISYGMALQFDPDYTDALHGLANLCMIRGDIGKAQNLYSQILKEHPHNMAVRYSLAQVSRAAESDENFAALVQLAGENNGAPRKDLIFRHFALGKCYDDLGDYQRAFLHFSEGCRLKRSSLDYHPEDVKMRFTDIMKTFDHAAIERLRGMGNPSNLPIFVLGMPRSGTTLVEQIITSHADVHGAGEFGELLRILRRDGHQDIKNQYSSEKVKMLKWGEEYISALKKQAPNAKHVTDKMPSNFFAIGLIHLMLPNAKIIHVNRNPIDTCLSCFTQLFSYTHEYSYDLAELGQYYAVYVRLMEHWRNVLPEGAFLDVKYEDIVSDQEMQTRRIIEYCGLEWSDACLDFHNNARPVQTASILQVRQPIYNSSVERWRRYEKSLGPLLDALGDLAPNGYYSCSHP